MEFNPSISVIVPVYNAEKYLERCIDSILKQTFTNFELLLINDGSTDRSGDICDKYAKTDCRVKVFHQKNSGAVIARKEGLKESTGEYIVFIDSDDYISSIMLDVLFVGSNNGKHDLVLCNYKEITSDGEIIKYNNEYKSNIEYIVNMIEGNIGAYLWNKLIKRDLFIKHVKMNEGNDMWEDMQISIQLFFYAKSIKILNTQPLYYYNCTNNLSLTSRKGRQMIDSMVNNIIFIERFLKDNSIAPTSILENRKIYCKLLIIRNIIGADYWRKTFPEINFSILYKKDIPKKYKVLVILIICHLDKVYKACQFIFSLFMVKRIV